MLIRISGAVTLAAGLALGHSALADIPRIIPFQGTLADATNHPKAAGTYTITFRLFANPAPVAGEIPLWAETNLPVTVAGNGQFNVTLGSPTAFPASLAFHDPAYLEVQVVSDAPMTPRLPLLSVPYAINAGSLSLPFSGTGAAAGSPALEVVNSAGGGIGVHGDGDYAGVKGTAGKGRYGMLATNADGAFAFLAGPALTSGSVGVYGTGSVIGAMGESNAGDGVHGVAHGNGLGVWGDGQDGDGVMGQTTNGNEGVLGLNGGNGVGVTGTSAGGVGVDGYSGALDGVRGTTLSSQHAGVSGLNPNGGFGVYGQSGNAAGGIGSYGRGDGVGIGVYGYSTGSGAAVRAESAGTGPALEIQSGAIRVTGAGVGTPTAAFIHVANSTNTTTNVTTIDNPLCNGDPNAILIVTPNYTPGEVFTPATDCNPFRVVYSAGHWQIFDCAADIPLFRGQGPAWNVLVIKP